MLRRSRPTSVLCTVALVTLLGSPLAKAGAQGETRVVVEVEEAPRVRTERKDLRGRGQRQRVAGVVLMLLGIGLGAGGGVALSRCCSAPDNLASITSIAQVQPLVDDARSQLILGTVLAGVGFSALVTGITLTAVGQSNVNAARRLGPNVSVGPAPTGALGGSLRIGF